MSVNPANTAGQGWGYLFASTPTPADSDYNLNDLAFTTDGSLYIIVDNTPGAAVWKPFGFFGVQVYSVKNIDATSTGQTLIVTPNPMYGGRFIVSSAFIQLKTVSGLTTPPIVSIGTLAGSYINIITDTALTGLTTQNYLFPLPLNAIPFSVATNSNIYLNVSTAAVSTTYTINCIIEGIYN